MKFFRWLLILVPIVFGMELANIGGHSLMFILSALSLIPLAAVLGEATEEVAHFTGPKIGGFLNATLGNAAELIITIVALREGLVEVVKASIAGSIIGNILVVLGLAIFLGGLKHGIQTFDSNVASLNSSVMTLSIMALMIPAIFALGAPEHRPSEEDIVRLSDGTAIVLIILYVFYLFFTIFRPETRVAPVTAETHGHFAVREHEASHWRDEDVFGVKNGAVSEAADSHPAEKGGLMKPLVLLVLATLAIVFMSEILVGALEPTAEAWGLSELFVGVMLVPLVGNIAEHLVAVQQAMKNHMELSMGIAMGSAVQIALFVAPVLVLVSQFVGPEPMNLVFNPFELVALLASVLIAISISGDGRSNWMEGLELVALYIIIGVAFFFVP